MTEPDSHQDSRFMAAALAFSRRNLGVTAPNPCVGALLVSDGVVIGRGVTAPGGRPHAEPQALDKAGSRAAGATLYVTLEPCSHHGRTRPCVDAVVNAGVSRVVIGIEDPDHRVAGRGVHRLREAGIEVTSGICAAEARRHLLGHLLRTSERRPMVTLKLAETTDGFAAGVAGAPRLLITDEVANAWVHGIRALHDAVLVGAGTLRQDDPLLTVRLPGMAARQPLRVGLMTRGDLPIGNRLAATATQHPVLLLTSPATDPVHTAALARLGVMSLAVATSDDGRPDLRAALEALAERGVTRLFCEGGPSLGDMLMRQGLVDEVALLTGSRPLGHPGVPALGIEARAVLTRDFRLVDDRSLGPDRLRRYERIEPCSPD